MKWRRAGIKAARSGHAWIISGKRMRSIVALGLSSERETCSAFERVMRGLKECS